MINYNIGTPPGAFADTPCLPSCARLRRARTQTVHRTVWPFRVRAPVIFCIKKEYLAILSFLGTPPGAFADTPCLPSCARLRRARTQTVHRTVWPFRVRAPVIFCIKKEYLAILSFLGTPPGARTLDTLIKSQVLYQLS